MGRKLVKQGAGGTTVCLPKKWIDRHSLKPGDEINITEEGRKLIINTSKSSQKRLEIDLGQSDKYLIRWVISYAHNTGYDEIKINFKEIPIHSDYQVER